MSENLRQLLEEAIKLELSVGRVYRNFHHMFREDSDFWWELALEEKNHAELLERGRRDFLAAGMFPPELVGNSLEALVNANNEVKSILSEEKKAPSTRSAALNLALHLEELAGEIHFQHAMQQAENPSDAIRLFQMLNKDDKSHADRIRNYMLQNNIEINCH